MKILVLDSEKSACELLVRTLQGLFPEHEWLTAFSYDEGRQLAERGGRLDFVLADLKTNEAGGPSLAHLIEGMFPEVQTYFLGNYTAETTFFRARPGRTFPKPVNVHQVVAAIHLAEESLALKSALKEAETGARDEAKTNTGGALERINRLIAHEGFTGQLAQFQLHEIVQICCLGMRTGRMTVTKGHESGVLYFHEGRLLHAECGELQGEPAVGRIIGWRAGQFAFADGILADRETIQTSWDFLLLETMRQMDEAAAGGVAVRTELKEGQCFGPYHLVRRVAIREQEHVFEAQLSHNGLLVTLHVLPPAQTRSAVAVKQFVAEAAAKSELDGTTFLRATKAAQTEGVYYHTLEHVEATSLEDFGPERQLAETQVLEILRTVSQSMSELQAQHLLHHPLTPRDVLVNGRGQVRLANLASLRPDATLTVAAQIEALALALNRAAGPSGLRSSVLKRLLRRIQRPGPDQIVSWASLRKAVEGISLNAVMAGGVSDEHTSFIVNLVPDRPTLGVFKLAAVAGAAGLLAGGLFWFIGRFDHASAREGPPTGGLMAAEPGQRLAQPPSSVVEAVPTNSAIATPRVFGSITEMLEAPQGGASGLDSPK